MSLMQLIFALRVLTLTDDQLIETVIEIPNTKKTLFNELSFFSLDVFYKSN